MKLKILAALACVGMLAGADACSSSTSPHGERPSGIAFSSGDHQTDTIGSVLSQALEVRVTRVPAGDTPGGQVVQFIAILDSAGTSYEVMPQSVDQPGPQPAITDTLSRFGQASVGIVLGAKAGPARLIVTVPAFGYTDTARFTVTPGNPTNVTVSPNDTTLIIGSNAALRVSIADRAGNPRTDSVRIAVTSGPATVSGATMTTTAFGRITLVTSDGAASATTHASSVPSGTLAASTGFGIAIFNMDGSDYTVLPFNQFVGNIKWAPAGMSLVFDETGAACDGGNGTLQTTDLNGNVLTTVHDPGWFVAYPSYSRDGTWIYFTRFGGGVGATWRMHPDGTGADSLAISNPGFDFYPSPAPNGQHVAYGAYMIGPTTADLRVLDVSSGAVTDLGVVAWSPQWSPTSNQIAYIAGSACGAIDGEGTIAIVNADGTDAHRLGSNSKPYFPGFDWSPDGHWLVALDATNGLIDVIDATTGEAVPLTFSNNLSYPAWRPGQPSMARFQHAPASSRPPDRAHWNRDTRIRALRPLYP